MRPITVSVSVGAGSLFVYAYSVRACLKTNTAGLRWVDYCYEVLPDASVKVEPVADVDVGSGWLTTDSIGRARAVVTAPTSSEPDAAGLVHGRVRLKAVKDRASFQRERDIRMPYAMVASARGATLIARAGSLIDPAPIMTGQTLRPGDAVQVGSALVGSGVYLTVHYCNGQAVTLQSDNIGGLKAVVGQGSLDHRQSVLTVALGNVVRDVRNDPRRLGRMLVYKALGNTVDGFLGIPDPVGWTVTTPGGAVESWLADWAESAYQPRHLHGPAAGELVRTDAPWAAGMVDFYSDGTARIYNHGGTVGVRGPAASKVIPRVGMTVARLDTPGGALSSVGLAPVTGFAPLIRLVPAPETPEVPPRPDFEVWVTEFGGNEVIPGSLLVRVDGRLLPGVPREENRYVLTLPAGMVLTPGSHQWDVELALSGGGLVRTSATFQVTATLPPPADLQAVAGTRQVALRWSAEGTQPTSGGFRVYWRVPGGTRERISGEQPLREPNFVDTAPAAGAVYEVVALDADLREGAPSAGVSVTFPGPAPVTPRAITVTPVVGEEDAGLALAIEDPTPGFTLWRVEAAETAEGPFTDVLEGGLTSRNPWPIPQPFTETRRWFRVSAVNADGEAGPATIVGPLGLPQPWPVVTGLTVSPNEDGSVLLRWNPWHAAPLTGYRVERWVNTTWQTATTVAAEITSWTDPLPPAEGGLRQWRVRALVSGAESPPSDGAALRLVPVPADRGTVRLANAALTAVEGETVQVRVIREGGLTLPAFVTWSTWAQIGTATPDSDFTPGAGLLAFAPGESEKVISVPVQTDAFSEPDKSFYVSLRGVEGGPLLSDPASVQVTIQEGGHLRWEPRWYYAQEGQTHPVVFSVVLNRPYSQPVTVDYQFDADRSSASPGADFTGPLAGTLTFAPGQTNQSFTLTILDDDRKEGPNRENVVYRLHNPQGAALDTSDPFAIFGTLELADDDTRPGYVVFVDQRLTLREGESRGLTLRRLGGSDGSLEVFLFPMSGTATEDQDWTLAPRMPRFENGQTELLVTFTARNDGQQEGAELVVLGLHGGMGPHQSSAVVISLADADGAPSGYAAWADQQLAQHPPALRLATADADGDGRPNWVEFMALTNPTQPDRPVPFQTRFNDWGEWQVVVRLREDTSAVVWAEFAADVSWAGATFDAGQWESPGDGTRLGTFRHFSFGAPGAFMRLALEWLGPP